MRKLTSVSYGVLFILGMALALAAQFTAKPVRLLSFEKPGWQKIENVSAINVSSWEREFTFDWHCSDAVNSCLVFFASHQNVWVYADDALVYSREKADTVYGRTTGSGWNFVEIPWEAERVKVRVESIYGEFRGKPAEFHQGNARQMYADLLKNSMLEVIVSIIDIAVGIGMIGYWLVVKGKMKFGKDVFFFGIVAVLVGLWSVNETDAARLLASNRVAAYFFACMTLMLVSTPFILFETSFMEMKQKRIPDVLCIGNLLSVMICTVLHLTGILEFRKTLFITHIQLLAALAYTLWMIAAHIKEHGFDKKAKINLAGVAVLAISCIVDLVFYYMDFRQTDIIGKFGLLIFIFLIGSEAVLELVAKIDEGKKAEVYHELAVKDMLTGLYNRNAYYNWQEEHQHQQDILLVTFDLNNLKKWNDTKGHTAGDVYIKTAASMIEEVFGNEGCCYRIGGDEFCVVMKGGKKVDIDQKLEQLRLLQEHYNKSGGDLEMQIACGYAVFDGKKDKSVEDTRDRADILMYENKRVLKDQEGAV